MADESAVEKRLAELGLSVPNLAVPVAAYVPAVLTGSYVFTSGQLPFVDGVLPRTGKVGAEVSPDGIRGSVAVQEADGVLDLAIGGRAWGHGYTPEVRARPDEILHATGETVLAATLHRGFRSEVHTEDAEFPTGHIELDPALHFLEVKDERGCRLVGAE